ncbi:hypothetical protein RchiOBHm_Chr3g0475771 [Rosa chinensis]|uniref:Late embryogenesis abundant protein, LEA-14 n=1 Tax=Rosa chinensis TaxID=74649 RepID=A0A2P6RCI7_ROSCH|nr:hypothetical protein RchiOBHm_Chr3g0475771 [Rosa chinensis]
MTMEMDAKGQLSITMQLLPVSNNSSKPYISRSFGSHYIPDFTLSQLMILLITLGTILSLPCIFMSMSQFPQTPNIQLHSLFISKLNISNTTLGANWDLTLKIENPNLVSWIRFNDIKGSILYKNNHLVMYSVEPFVLGLKENRIMQMKMSNHKLEMNKWVLEEIGKQYQDGGAVQFSLQMSFWGMYRNGWRGKQNFIMNPRCSDLKVGFLPQTGFGTWLRKGEHMMCSVNPNEDKVDGYEPVIR